MSLFVEDAAEAVVPVDVEPGDGGRLGIGEGTGRRGLGLTIP
jgi:hypothetical protein